MLGFGLTSMQFTKVWDGLNRLYSAQYTSDWKCTRWTSDGVTADSSAGWVFCSRSVFFKSILQMRGLFLSAVCHSQSCWMKERRWAFSQGQCSGNMWNGQKAQHKCRFNCTVWVLTQFAVHKLAIRFDIISLGCVSDKAHGTL